MEYSTNSVRRFNDSSSYSRLLAVIAMLVWPQFCGIGYGGSAGVSDRINLSIQQLLFDSDEHSGTIGGDKPPLYISNEAGANGICT